MNLDNIIELQKNRMSVYGSNNQDVIYNTTFENFEENPAYKVVEHNSVKIGIHFITKTGKYRHREIYVITKPPYSINVGDYIHDEYGNLWMCYGLDDYPIRKNYVDLCNHKLKWIDSQNNLISKDCIVSAKTLYTTGVKDEKVIEIPNGMVGIQMPYDVDTKQLDRNQTFIFNKTKYKMTFYNEIEFDGLILLICTETAINTITDDVVNEIADRWTKEKVDRLPWLDTQVPPIEPPVEPTQGITYTITSIDDYDNTDVAEIWATDWAKFTVHKFIDDIEVSGLFTFEIDSTNLVTMTVNGSTATITAKDIRMGGNLKLTVTDTETNQIAIEKIIAIKGY